MLYSRRRARLAIQLTRGCRILLLIILIAALCAPGRALADGWARLADDGRVVIQVKDVRLAFPAQGSDVHLVIFSDQKREMTLEKVVASADEARDVLSRSGLITVSIPNVTDKSDLWLTKFNRWEFRTLSIGIAIGGAAAVGNCEAWEAEVHQLRASLTANDRRVGGDGWAEFVVGKSPVSRIYLQTRTPTFISDMTCNSLGTCYVPKCLAPNVGLSYSFSEIAYDRAVWSTFNAKVENVLKFILVDLVK